MRTVPATALSSSCLSWLKPLFDSFGPSLSILFLTCLGLTSLLAQSDTTPPNLVGLSITPTALNVTSSAQTITISLTLTDDLSGVTFGYPFFYNEFSLVSPSGKQTITLTNGGASFQLVAGTTLSGVWQQTLTIPQFSEAGAWKIDSIRVPDVAQNVLALTTAQLSAMGFPTTVNVVSIADTEPPTLVGFSFVPSTIDVTNATQQVTVSVALNDTPAGVVFPGGNQLGFAFLITSPSGKQTQWLATTQFTLTSGTAQSGVWQAALPMPQHSEAGAWAVQQLVLQDAAHNTETLNAAGIRALGFSSNLAVEDASPDITAPQLTGLNFFPRFLDTSSGAQTVTVSMLLTDNLSGVSFAPTSAALSFAYGPFFQNPTFTKTIFGGCAETTGTPQNGTWQCTLNFPPFADAGAWILTNISLKDADENTINYNASELAALGFPVVLNINQSSGGGGGSGRSSAVAALFGSAGTSANPTALVAEPVNSATGNYFSQHQDLAVRGRGLSFILTRYYNSLDAYSGPLGLSWTHSYNFLLTQNSQNGQVTIKQGNGSTISFTSLGGGQYTPKTVGLFDSLMKNADGSLLLVRKNQTKLAFTSLGQLTSITDRNGNTQTLAYAPNGNLLSVTDTVGRVFSFTYDGLGHLTSVIDSVGRTVRYSYDATGNLSTFQDALGALTQYAYDSNNLLVSATDPRNVVYVKNTYDASERVVVQQNGRLFATTFAYDTPVARTTTFTDPLGNATHHVYDTSTRLIAITNALGGTTIFTYDSNNNRTAITDANGKTTQFSYDAKGNVTGVMNALGNAAAFVYDSHNKIVKATNPVGSVTVFSYDANSNLISIKDSLGNITSFSYDGSGEVLASTNAIGNTSSLTYDSFGNLVRVANALGNGTGFGYDGISRVTSITDANGHTFSLTYDALVARRSEFVSMGGFSFARRSISI